MPTILMSYVALLILVLNAANAFRGPWASSIETTTRTPSSPHVKMEPDPKLSSTMANLLITNTPLSSPVLLKRPLLVRLHLPLHLHLRLHQLHPLLLLLSLVW